MGGFIKMLKHNFIFGIFTKGSLVFQIGQPIKCNHITATIIVGILDLAKGNLLPGHYFACDFKTKTEGHYY